MKYIITESQFVQLSIRRRLNKIKNLFNERMTAYPPCDYDYEDGFIDYFGAVRYSIIDTLTDELGLYNFDSDDDDEDDEGGSLFTVLNNVIYDMFYQEAIDFYEGVIDRGCEEYEEGDGEEEDN